MHIALERTELKFDVAGVNATQLWCVQSGKFALEISIIQLTSFDTMISLYVPFCSVSKMENDSHKWLELCKCRKSIWMQFKMRFHHIWALLVKLRIFFSCAFLSFFCRLFLCGTRNFCFYCHFLTNHNWIKNDAWKFFIFLTSKFITVFF